MILLNITVAENVPLDINGGISRFIRKTLPKFRIAVESEMRGKKSGKLYKRKKGNGFSTFHQASAIGEAPATDSGKYLASLKTRFPTALSGLLENTVPYAEALEAKRPMYARIIDRMLPELTEDLEREILK